MTADLTKLIAEGAALAVKCGDAGPGYWCDATIGNLARKLLPQLVSVITEQAAALKEMMERLEGEDGRQSS